MLGSCESPSERQICFYRVMNLGIRDCTTEFQTLLWTSFWPNDGTQKCAGENAGPKFVFLFYPVIPMSKMTI